ncbi:TDP-4-oxo-6-deoxy-alpha-D-glucose-3,4-oxoisomerase [Tepidimonas alkaliphilus]|uniref:TDP-4-oxo-6-deoxy-alpha-D-glucose-3, 4-oxoisomerase n=1 Tax=Tepidimonas alkaliphilus TaxID=2588942 RepID=A0A554W4Z3_9BURK|nr:FdtA/QdtA family cupin domain-containing protein [Tepidimonas alkaliphilus]TSE18645.1 TDP-4-oxo-6-deoxy-alpha-D-glucose-3,4-oxoisomerase [Tepidimonas alkaliphilus]
MTEQLASPSRFALIELPFVHDARGDLTFIEGRRHIPFEIARVYYLFNVPVDSVRGGHAHRKLEQVIFALSGSFRVRVDTGQQRADFWLRDPRKGLYLANYVWRELDSFSQGAVAMVLASTPYEEADYIRDYHIFLREVEALR